MEAGIPAHHVQRCLLDQGFTPHLSSCERLADGLFQLSFPVPSLWFPQIPNGLHRTVDEDSAAAGRLRSDNGEMVTQAHAGMNAGREHVPKHIRSIGLR